MQITHDFHIHTHLSTCADRNVTVRDYLKAYRDTPIRRLGFADHLWDSAIPGTPRFYRIQNVEHVEEIKADLAALTAEERDGFEILYGCETEYDYAGHGVGLSEAAAETFDFIIVPNSHTHITMPKEFYEPPQKHKEYMIEAYKDIIRSPIRRYITSIAHPFDPVNCPYPRRLVYDLITDDEFRRLFDETAEAGIAVEINLSAVKNPEVLMSEDYSMVRMFRAAKECGCRFTFGTDAHKTDDLRVLSNAAFMVELLGLTEDDLCDIVKGK